MNGVKDGVTLSWGDMVLLLMWDSCRCWCWSVILEKFGEFKFIVTNRILMYFEIEIETDFLLPFLASCHSDILMKYFL